MNDNLNKEQLKAVQEINGPVRIIAGPGTGKTKTIVSKVIHILKNNLAKPENILIITFTNKAANEIRERIEKEYDKKISNVFTYHAWAAYFLRIQFEKINLDKNFKILDMQDSKSILKKIIKEFKLEIDLKDSQDLFEMARNKSLKPNGQLEKNIISLYQKYVEKKNEISALDFDDLLIKVEEVLRLNPEICEFYREKYKYVFIDEFQDTNDVQFELIKLITRKNSNITIVGDPDQNIYSWRGSNVKLILNFDKYYEGAKTIVLKQNYRSTPNILKAANNLILRNKERIIVDLFTENKINIDIEINNFFNSLQEARYVIEEILSLKKRFKYKFSDFAIIFRNNYISKDFEKILLENKIPYKLIGAFKFYERSEVKEALNFIHFLIFKDNYSLENIINVPSKGIGDVTIKKISDASIKESSSYWQTLINKKITIPKLEDTISIFERYIKEGFNKNNFEKKFNSFFEEIKLFDYYKEDENKIKNIKFLTEQIGSYLNESSLSFEETIQLFFHASSLQSSSDVYDYTDSLNLITIHAAKGTEFKVVFFVTVNQGIIPSFRSYSSKALEEERRAAYVAITRAKERLYISYVDSIFGKQQEKSQFISEINIPTNNYNYLSEKNSLHSHLSNSSITNGDLIIHASYGEGIVIEDSGQTIKVAFDKKIGIKELLKNHLSVKKK